MVLQKDFVCHSGGRRTGVEEGRLTLTFTADREAPWGGGIPVFISYHPPPLTCKKEKQLSN